MVNLTRIYTRTGDAGNTRLSDNAEVPKTDLRVEAYGAADETNSDLALAVTHGGLPERVVEILAPIHSELFDVDADLSTPLHPDPQYPPPRVEQSSIDRLEEWCDELGAELPSLRSFILPGGGPVAAQLHVACTVCRRVERMAWQAVQVYGTEPSTERDEDGMNLLVITCLNRLSDLLFNMCRAATGPEGDVLRVLGTDHQSPGRRHGRTRK